MTSLKDFDVQNVGKDCSHVIGLDEVGRGCIVGPVVACACLFNVHEEIGVDVFDSKSISPKRREEIASYLRKNSVFSFGFASAAEVDSLNVLKASLLAMTRALVGLGNVTATVLVDGNFLPMIPENIETSSCFPIVKGDSKSRCIAASSILAKVKRDEIMFSLDEVFPQYGFARHKGYPTKIHIDSINKHGIIDEHRKTFGPIKKYIDWKRGIDV